MKTSSLMALAKKRFYIYYIVWTIMYWSGVKEGAYEAQGPQPQSHAQGARTPDWPAQPTTKP